MIKPAALARLIEVIRRPATIHGLSVTDWDDLIRLARASGLAGRLANAANAAGGLGQVPDGVARYLTAWGFVTDKLEADLRYELDEIRQALAGTGITPVLLKGAAYSASRQAWAVGRHYSDIDLMVPFEALPAVERALLIRGWQPSHRDDPYTQKYYRQWMHEIPPLSHVHRGTTIDLHHAITPRTSRIRSDGSTLVAAAEPIANAPGFLKLTDIDQLIHCATHVFSDTEIPKGFRDLLDFDALLTQCHAHDEVGAQRIADRAATLGLGAMVFLAWRQAHRLIDTPPPPACVRRFAPNAISLAALDAIYARALPPEHPLCDRPGAGLARTAVLLRGHWLRMPLHLLVSHLVRKAFSGALAQATDEKKADPQG